MESSDGHPVACIDAFVRLGHEALGCWQGNVKMRRRLHKVYRALLPSCQLDNDEGRAFSPYKVSRIMAGQASSCSVLAVLCSPPALSAHSLPIFANSTCHHAAQDMMEKESPKQYHTFNLT